MEQIKIKKNNEDAERVAKTLSKIPPAHRKVIVGQMNAALITYQVLKPYLAEESKEEDEQ